MFKPGYRRRCLMMSGQLIDPKERLLRRRRHREHDIASLTCPEVAPLVRTVRARNRARAQSIILPALSSPPPVCLCWLRNPRRFGPATTRPTQRNSSILRLFRGNGRGCPSSCRNRLDSSSKPRLAFRDHLEIWNFAGDLPVAIPELPILTVHDIRHSCAS